MMPASDKDQVNVELHRLGMKLKFVYSIVGLLLGLSCILSGSLLGLFGVTGHSSFTASMMGLSTQLNDAAPGVVVFVVGIFMVLITRFKVKEERVVDTVTKPDGSDKPSGASTATTGRTVFSYKTHDPGRPSW